MPLVAYSATATAISIKDFAFQPSTVVIHAGDAISWTNLDGTTHTATDVGIFDTGNMGYNATRTITFGAPGTYLYYCVFHSIMFGAVIVIPADQPLPAGAPTIAPAAHRGRLPGQGPRPRQHPQGRASLPRRSHASDADPARSRLPRGVVVRRGDRVERRSADPQGPGATDRGPRRRRRRGHPRHRTHALIRPRASARAAPGLASALRPAGQAGPPGHPGRDRLSRLRDPRQVRRGVRA